MLHVKSNLRKAILVLALPALSVISCKKESDTAATGAFIGEWKGAGCNMKADKWNTKSPNFATGRKGGFAFSVNNEIYVGGGQAKKDFWNYVPTSNSWARLDDVPGTISGRIHATGFGIGNYGYVFGGADTTLALAYNDLQRFDPTSSLWSTMPSMPGTARFGAFVFIINNVAYVGGGIDQSGNVLKDMWAFDPNTSAWVQKADMPAGTAHAFAFQINNYGYVSAGTTTGSNADTTTYVYDPTINVWGQKKGFVGPRMGGVSFEVGGKAYCGLGANTAGALYNDFYTFDPVWNTWTRVGAYPGEYAQYSVAAVANGRAYAGMGNDLGLTAYNKWYEYTPPSLATSFTITPGANNYTLNMSFDIGNDTCNLNVTIKGVVNTTLGSDIFSINNQDVVDNCGNNYSIGGSGKVVNNGDSIYITTIMATASGTSACTFKGRR